ncbi:MAG: DUF3147 family protein [Bauldia litoralis]
MAAVRALMATRPTEVAKRSPALGALVVSLPLTSLLAFIWFYRDAGDTESIAALSQSTFWFILPSLPMFLVLPVLLRAGLVARPRAVLPAHGDALLRHDLSARPVRDFRVIQTETRPTIPVP